MSLALSLACGWEDETYAAQAVSLAKSLSLPSRVVDDVSSFPYDYVLLCCEAGWVIQPCGAKPSGPIQVDFVGGSVGHRRQFGGGQGQMIAKACGVARGIRPRVADVTAGLGRDAFVLASLGCTVTLIERSPVIHCLLQDGIKRAELDGEVSSIVARMHLHHAQARDWLMTMASEPEEVRPQVVYLDPMFPHRDKSALVKKEMLIFRDLVGADEDADSLLDAALDAAVSRVVVKRPRKAPTLMQRSPSYQLEGKTSRFDIYTLKKLS